MDPAPLAHSTSGSLQTLPKGAEPVRSAPAGPRSEGLRPEIGRLLERMVQPFAVVDFQGRVLRVNRAYLELTGYSEGELLQMSVTDLTTPRWHQKSLEVLSVVLATGRPIRYEKEYRRKDGALVQIELTVDLHRDDGDHPTGFYAFVTDISERKRAADALRESEERYRQLYDEAPVGYHEIDADGRIVNINQTGCDMLGYRFEQVIGLPIFDLLAEEERENARRALHEKFAGIRALAPIERKMVTRDGRRIIVAIQERYRRDAKGKPAGILCTVQDITERKLTEAALLSSERRARALFDGIEDAVFVHSPEGRILDANPAASRLLGYSHAELLALSTKDIDAPDFAVGYQARLQQQMTSGHLTCEGWHRTKFGRIIPVEIATSFVQFDQESAVLAVSRDISERKALEEARVLLAEAQARNTREMEEKNKALTQSEARYRQLTEGCLDGVVVADGGGRVVLFNPAAQTIFGYDPSEILGQPLTLLIPPEEGTVDVGQNLLSGDPRIVGKTVELRGLRKNGERFPLELSLSAVDVAGDRQFIGSVRDQTERQRMQAMLVQQDKLASIGQLSAGVAHEINNPLAYVANNLAVLEREIKGVVQILALYEAERPTLAPAVPDTLAKIDALCNELDWPYLRENLDRMLSRTREGVQRVANIVHSLRNLARTSNVKLESVPLAELLESSLEMVRGRLRRENIEVIVEHGDVPPVQCMPSQIAQVLLNLLINAAQAVEGRWPDGGGWVRVATRCDGNMAVLEVSDNGCGIPADVMPRLFDPFFTTKPVGEGTGLGLSISHGIVNGHGGRIEVESSPQKGSCFRVLLPLKPI
ncbi:MAG: PAS domain S-box protein [Isosphaeraceae bacterium]|nr:PAS domain S-box protein [Isosphaeraceae bacterium]